MDQLLHMRKAFCQLLFPLDHVDDFVTPQAQLYVPWTDDARATD